MTRARSSVSAPAEGVSDGAVAGPVILGRVRAGCAAGNQVARTAAAVGLGVASPAGPTVAGRHRAGARAGLRACGVRQVEPARRLGARRPCGRWRGCRWTRATTTRCGSGATSPPRWTGCGPAWPTASVRSCPASAATSFAGAVTALVNEFAAAAEEVALVVDDYHLIETPDVHRSLEFLLDHLPPRCTLVLASRSDPPLPLARLRARGQLAELRAARPALHRRTRRPSCCAPRSARTCPTASSRRWASAPRAGPRGCSWRRCRCTGAATSPRFVAEFSGSHRFVLDYLTEEVLDRQPAELRTFLLETSVLDRLSGPLCDAVLGRTDSQQLLESVERANLFLLPLDEERRWWRYHHLFADLLRARLQRAVPRPGARAAPRRRGLVRGARPARRGHPPRAGGRRHRPGGPARRGASRGAGLAARRGRHARRVARRAPARGDPPQAAADARAGRRRAHGGQVGRGRAAADRGRARAATAGRPSRTARRSSAGPACWPTSRPASRSCRAELARMRGDAAARERRSRRPRSPTSREQDELLGAIARYHVAFADWLAGRVARRRAGAGRGLRRAGRVRAARPRAARAPSTSAPSSRLRVGWVRRCAPTSAGSRSRQPVPRRRPTGMAHVGLAEVLLRARRAGRRAAEHVDDGHRAVPQAGLRSRRWSRA